MKKSALILLLTAVVGVAQAHPGHGHGNPLSPGHYVSSPEHALPLTLAIAAGVILILWLTSRFQDRPIKK
jgi:hypothetical protein